MIFCGFLLKSLINKAFIENIAAVQEKQKNLSSG
jgi:hypothetical protein